MKVIISDRIVIGKEDVHTGDKIGVVVNGVPHMGEVTGLSYRTEMRCNMRHIIYERIEAIEVKTPIVPSHA